MSVFNVFGCLYCADLIFVNKKVSMYNIKHCSDIVQKYLPRNIYQLLRSTLFLKERTFILNSTWLKQSVMISYQHSLYLPLCKEFFSLHWTSNQKESDLFVLGSYVHTIVERTD